ncbi:MAG: hypothetical protein LAO21_20500 [Acidobacteriia bacterium]|nr:hypothetical protein [Terriglobia bacterium]
MAKSAAVTMLVSYYPKKGKEKKLLALIKKQWPVLHRAALVSKMNPQIWRASDKQTHRLFFVEMFQWKDARASDVAHRTPEVMAIWGPMEPLLENLQLSRIEPIPLRPAQ